MSRLAALIAAAAALAAVAGLAAAAPASGATRTITMNGAPITRSLVADLAYFYRHQHRRAPRFTLAGGGTSAGIADTARKVTDAGLVARALVDDDPRGLRLTPLAWSGVCLDHQQGQPGAGDHARPAAGHRRRAHHTLEPDSRVAAR